MNKIIITGGNGRLAKVLKKYFYGKNISYLDKKKFNILKYKSINNFLKKNKINTLIHLAGLSRPMNIHETEVEKSIQLNIIGTANVVMACRKNNVKLIYLSTNYVYPCMSGNYKEEDSLKPFNNYGWSKLGGEAAVQMYPNSLILRACITEKPFIHSKAFSNINSSFIFHDEFAKNFSKILNKSGIINIGGINQSIYKFAIKSNPKIKPKKSKIKQKNQSLNIKKFYKIINK